jgi:GNAT superfamily N-acetyltransferase
VSVVPDVPQITLLPLTDAEYAEFTERQVAESARQRVQAGEWTPAQSLTRAREECSDLLADRLRGHGHLFLKGLNAAGAMVGWLWVGPAPAFLERYGVREPARVRWLGQITVAEDQRGRGYGRALLEELHAQLAAEGVEAIYLRIYDWNAAARRLYARSGYEVVRQFSTDAHLRKQLSMH